jgi:SAM-dependent methyltransferase
MKKNRKHWTKTMFVDKAGLFHANMNQAWKNAPKITRQIKKVLGKYNKLKGRILELGCGNGRISINLAKMGYSVTGVDISKHYLADARARAARARAKTLFVHGDFRRIDTLVHGKFDAVISIWTSLGFYDQRTDQLMFKKVAQLLKKKGLFLILMTMSRERILNIFNRNLFHECNKYIILNENSIDQARSIIYNRWRYYRKVKKNLIYDDEIAFTLRVYAIPEYVAMAENAGMEFREAFQSILTLEPPRSDSPANLVFQKP